MRMSEARPQVGIIMGSKSDWETMRHADEILSRFDIAHECRVVSAHRTPVMMAEYATLAAGRGLEVIIAGAGGAAHLPGMVAAHTVLPVIGVPVQSAALNGRRAVVHRADAERRARCDRGDRSVGRRQCRPARGRDSRTSRPDLRARLQQFRDDIGEQVRRESLP
jgi:5-(carboxyamino)imidazole ribonucleotide mutase